MKGLFIVLEGIDGSGTTTQVELLVQELRRRGLDARSTFEPTGRSIGAVIRQVLQHKMLDAEGTPARLPWSSMALLFAADRLDHVENVVRPALAEGAVVVSDRYYLSSLAYQSATSPDGGQALEWLRSINSRAPAPDLTIVLDVPAELAESRRAARGGEPELFETHELQKQLSALYAKASELVAGDPLRLLDGTGDLATVHQRILEVVEPLLP